jgi:4-hydroxybenzoate polyprenyltransferase
MAGVIKTLRPVISIVCFIIGAAAVAMAYYDVYGELPIDYRFISAVIALWLGTVGSYGINDFFDMDIDSKAMPDRAIPAGDLSRNETLIVGIILCLLALAIIFFSFSLEYAWKFALVAVVSMILITVYSAYFKRKTALSFMAVVIAVVLMPIGIWLAFAPLALLPLLIGLVYLFFEPGFTLAGVCRDIEGDKERGVPTLPAKIGIANTATFTVIGWAFIIPCCIIIALVTGLGLIFLIGSLIASLVLIALGFKFLNNPDPETGGQTMIKASLFFWLFNLAIIADVIVQAMGWLKSLPLY